MPSSLQVISLQANSLKANSLQAMRAGFALNIVLLTLATVASAGPGGWGKLPAKLHPLPMRPPHPDPPPQAGEGAHFGCCRRSLLISSRFSIVDQPDGSGLDARLGLACGAVTRFAAPRPGSRGFGSRVLAQGVTSARRTAFGALCCFQVEFATWTGENGGRST